MDFILRTRLGRFEPNADVFVDEDRGQVIVTLELAGADPESLGIGLDGHDLVVAGRRPERARRRGSFVQKEIASGDFGRRIHLSVPVEYENAAASYADGVLVIVLPISPTAYRPTTRTELRILVKRTHS
jgi:HSP20 family molecular chaperone IbpA